MQATATIGKDHYKTTLVSRTHTTFADEPAEENGTDTAPTPNELLASALGACTAITLRMYSDRKGWNIDSIQVEVVRVENAEAGLTHLERKISFTGDISEEQKTRLLQVANACPVHKVLTNPIKIDSSIV